ncbi:MAG: PAS domain-containing protein [Solirubrobacteraceae bacterium]|nr:PAS domain-containing protein [Solirubrobacteraceae bacterium]
MSARVHGLPGLPGGSDDLEAFCGHCGRAPDGPASPSRVCQHCDLGLVLEAGSEVAPAPTEPFIVVDNRMAVCALSQAAEQLLGIQETAAVNRHLGELLLPADANAVTDGGLIETVLSAASAQNGAPVRRVVVRPLGVFGVRFTARVGRCGPAPSALIVLED